MTDIFMSYAHEDQARIRDLVSALEEKGWSIFWDRRIPAGKTWQSYIGRALNDARCMIVAWSHDSIISDWVIEEANEAKKRGFLIPVLLDPVEPPLGFRGVQAADLTDWKPGFPSTPFDQLAQDIAGVMGGEPRSPAPEGEMTARTQPVAIPEAAAIEPPHHEHAPSRPELHSAGTQEPKAIELGFAKPGEKRKRFLKRALIISTLAVAVVVAVVLWFSPRSTRSGMVDGPSVTPEKKTNTAQPGPPGPGPSKKKPSQVASEKETLSGAVPGSTRVGGSTSVSKVKTDAGISPPSAWRVTPDLVIDETTKLMWTRGDFKTITGRYAESWDEAIRWAAEMNAKRNAGYSDWQVASIPEYRTIRQPSWRKVFLSDNEDYYWARDEINAYAAAFINFSDGSVMSTDKKPRPDRRTGISRKFSARLVRSIK